MFSEEKLSQEGRKKQQSIGIFFLLRHSDGFEYKKMHK